jgi:uncharacterized protein YndB with AHSA1/START domain
MPLRTDGSGARWVEMEIVVPAAPEAAWQAVATGPGNTAWFTRTRIEERVGGAVEFDFGGGVLSKGEVTAWEPPLRFGYVETEWEPGAPPIHTEITLRPRKDGASTLRMTHTFRTGSDAWDGNLEDFERGWAAFFEVLKLYLRDFAGQPGGNMQVVVPLKDAPGIAWPRIARALALHGRDAEDRFSLPAEPQALQGTVERLHQDAVMRSALLRIDAPAPGLALLSVHDASHGAHASVSLWFYGAQAAPQAAAAEPAWRHWLEQLVGQPEQQKK